jgi:hypothetical protein
MLAVLSVKSSLVKTSSMPSAFLASLELFPEDAEAMTVSSLLPLEAGALFSAIDNSPFPIGLALSISIKNKLSRFATSELSLGPSSFRG